MSDKMNDAWAAGLFEGEGCISVQRNRSSRITPVLTLKMTDFDVVRRFRAIMGFGNIYETRPQSERHKPTLDWRQTGWVRLDEFAARIGPYLGERRQAKLAEVSAQRPVPGDWLPRACYVDRDVPEGWVAP